jgi:hypothetical protein
MDRTRHGLQLREPRVLPVLPVLRELLVLRGLQEVLVLRESTEPRDCFGQAKMVMMELTAFCLALQDPQERLDLQEVRDQLEVRGPQGV